jgi:hypothetical protein
VNNKKIKKKMLKTYKKHKHLLKSDTVTAVAVSILAAFAIINLGSFTVSLISHWVNSAPLPPVPPIESLPSSLTPEELEAYQKQTEAVVEKALKESAQVLSDRKYYIIAASVVLGIGLYFAMDYQGVWWHPEWFWPSDKAAAIKELDAYDLRQKNALIDERYVQEVVKILTPGDQDTPLSPEAEAELKKLKQEQAELLKQYQKPPANDNSGQFLKGLENPGKKEQK